MISEMPALKRMEEVSRGFGQILIFLVSLFPRRFEPVPAGLVGHHNYRKVLNRRSPPLNDNC